MFSIIFLILIKYIVYHVLIQDCPRLGNSQRKKKIHKFGEKSGNFTLSQGKLTFEEKSRKITLSVYDMKNISCLFER